MNEDQFHNDARDCIEWTATRLRDCWAIRPKGALGTGGWSPIPWTVFYLKKLPKGMAIEEFDE